MKTLSGYDQVSLLLNLLSEDSRQILNSHSEIIARSPPPDDSLLSESQRNLVGFVGALIELNLIPPGLAEQIESAFAWADGPSWVQDLQFEIQQGDPSLPKIVHKPTSAIVGVAVGEVILSKDEYIYRSFIDLINSIAQESPEQIVGLFENQLRD